MQIGELERTPPCYRRLTIQAVEGKHEAIVSGSRLQHV
jgi:hypothetical protein